MARKLRRLLGNRYVRFPLSAVVVLLIFNVVGVGADQQIIPDWAQALTRTQQCGFACGGGGDGGGSPPPAPTPDPYAWIRALPMQGQTATQYGVWEECPTIICTRITLPWYGVVNEGVTVLNPTTYTLDLTSVYLEITVLHQDVFKWASVYATDGIYSQNTLLGNPITKNPSCPVTIGLTPGYDTFWGMWGCDGSFIDAIGMNAIAHYGLVAGPGVNSISNYTLDFAHKLVQ